MTEQTGGTVESIIGVVAVPVKRNYLRHLAPSPDRWGTRTVHALCGWVGYAIPSDENDTSHFDKDGFRVRRRNCQRCQAAQTGRPVVR